MKVLCSKISNSFSNQLRQILHSQTHHQVWLGGTVSRFLWLRGDHKRVGKPEMLWSPLNQISTRHSALILELELKWFKSR